VPLTAAERKANQRQRAVLAGLCARCCRIKPKRGLKTCQECITASLEPQKGKK
jgi:hypothetical protein